MHSKRTTNSQTDPRGQEQAAARSYVPTLMFRLQRFQRTMAMGMLKKEALYVGGGIMESCMDACKTHRR